MDLINRNPKVEAMGMLKKYLFLIVCLMVLLPLLWLFFVGLKPVNSCSNVNLKYISKNYPSLFRAKILQKESVSSSLCKVLVENYNQAPQILYVSKEFVLNGNMFKRRVNLNYLTLKTYEKNLYKEELDSFNKNLPAKVNKLINKLNKATVAVYVPKNANGKVLYEFSDPLCPYCDMAKRNILKLANKTGYTVKLIWFIVHGEAADNIAEKLISANFTYKNYVKYFNTVDNPILKKDISITKYAKNKLKYDEKIDLMFKLKGTPTFITSTGKGVTGYDVKLLRADLS